MIQRLLLSALACSVALPAFAADDPGEKKFPVVKPGVTLFAHYGLDLSDGSAGYNEFGLDRAYLFLKTDVSKQLSMRLTLDADLLKGATITIPAADGSTSDVTVDTKTRVFVKHAYLEWKAGKSGVKARFGMSDTAWAPYGDGFWGQRYISKSVGDANKFVSTSDLGVQFLGEHAGGLVEWQAGVINGEGYGKPEIDASKTLQARVTVDPLAKTKGMKLPISGFFSQDVGGDGDLTTLYAGAVGYKMPYVTFWGEYMGRSEAGESGSLISVAVVPRIPKVLNVIARVDRVDPAASASDDETLTVIGGVSRDFYDKISAAATYEMSTGASENMGVYLRMQAGF